MAAIAQVVTVIAIIPSLVYVAAQIREQNKERQRAAVNVLIGQWSGLLKSMIDSSEIAGICLRGLQNFEDLAAVEKIGSERFWSVPSRLRTQYRRVVLIVRPPRWARQNRG